MDDWDNLSESSFDENLSDISNGEILSDNNSVLSDDEISANEVLRDDTDEEEEFEQEDFDDEYDSFQRPSIDFNFDDNEDEYEEIRKLPMLDSRPAAKLIRKNFTKQINSLDDYQEQYEMEYEEEEEIINEENFMYKLNDAIIEDSPERLRYVLKFVPVDIDVYEQILESLLPTAIMNNSIISYREMLKKYKEIYESASAVSLHPYISFLCKNRPDTMVQLYAMENNPSDLYKFLCDCFDLGIGPIIEEIATLSDEPKSAQYAKRVLEVYGMTNLYYLRELQDLIKEKDNIRVEEALSSYIAKISDIVEEYAERPKYIIPVTNIIPSVPEIMYPTLSPDQLFEYYKKVHTKPEYVLPEDHDRELRELVEKENSYISKILYLRDIISEDVEFHRLFGPSHNNIRRGSYSYDAAHICERYGGCRMLLCNCVEGIDEELQGEELEDADWFRGRCEVCGIGIRNRRFAVRRARKCGGWSGCYCSFGCVKSMKNMDRMDKEIQDEIEYSLKTNLIYEKIDVSNETEKYKESTLLNVTGN